MTPERGHDRRRRRRRRRTSSTGATAFPDPGTKAREARRARSSRSCSCSRALAGIAFIVVFVHGPVSATTCRARPQNFRFFTPLLGGLLAIMLVIVGLGAVLWAKWLMPEEEAVQDRHQEPSTEADKLMTAATLTSGLNDTGLPRRSMMHALAAARRRRDRHGAAGRAHRRHDQEAGRPTPLHGYRQSPEEYPNGVPIVYSDGRRISPDDLEPGGLATVFPGVPGAIHLSVLADPDHPPAAGSAGTAAARARRTTTSAISSRTPRSAPTPVARRRCTSSRPTRLLCPCHQSQFEVLQDALPVFGPATRPLPRLPLRGRDRRRTAVLCSQE